MPSPSSVPAGPPRPPLHYALSCGLLLVLSLLWNALLARFLPPAFAPSEFWREIPPVLGAVENIFRVSVFALPFVMPLRLSTPEHKNGLRLFVAGTLLYFASWLALIAAPDSAWARSAAGFLAPAYTPLPWLLGLAFMGRQLFWGQFYRWWMHLGLSLLFLAAHLSHAALVYVRHY